MVIREDFEWLMAQVEAANQDEAAEPEDEDDNIGRWVGRRRREPQ